MTSSLFPDVLTPSFIIYIPYSCEQKHVSFSNMSRFVTQRSIFWIVTCLVSSKTLLVLKHHRHAVKQHRASCSAVVMIWSSYIYRELVFLFGAHRHTILYHLPINTFYLLVGASTSTYAFSICSQFLIPPFQKIMDAPQVVK